MLTERYAGVEDVLERLNDSLDEAVVSAGWFAPRVLESMTIDLLFGCESGGPQLIQNAIGHDRKNPCVRIEVDGAKILGLLGDIEKLHSYIFDQSVRALSYAQKKFKLPYISFEKPDAPRDA